MNNVIGIDYSVNCPAICHLTGIPGDRARWFVHYRKIDGNSYPDLGHEFELTRSTTKDEISRFVELANWASGIIRAADPDLIIIEDYGFSASGRMTQLAENTGILKAKLHENFPGLPVQLVAPTAMKKFATTKGNADKKMVWEAFIKVFPDYSNRQTLCHPKAKTVGSPMNDIADSYFLAKYGQH